MIRVFDEIFLKQVHQLKPKKKRVTFSISEIALSHWCEKNAVTESATIETLIWKIAKDIYFQANPTNERIEQLRRLESRSLRRRYEMLQTYMEKAYDDKLAGDLSLMNGGEK